MQYDPETGEVLEAPPGGGLVPVIRSMPAPMPMNQLVPSPAEVIQEMKDRRALLHAAMKEILVEQTDPSKGGDYGKIPGCGDRPCLLLPGAQKLSSAFRFVPRYQVTIRDLGKMNREYDVKCLLHNLTGTLLGEGEGTCSSLETKYRYRPGPVELTDKAVPGDYWNIRKSDPKKAQAMLGGPGFVTKKDDGGRWMIAKKGESVDNPDPADLWNTLKKMACKRAFVAAVITATNASDVFTQDIEENPDLYRRGESPEPAPTPAPAQAPTPSPAAAPTLPMQQAPPPADSQADKGAPPPSQGDPGEPLATERQVKAMRVLMKNCGIQLDDPENLKNACRQLGPHDTPEAFTKKEAIAAIRELNEIAGAAK